MKLRGQSSQHTPDDNDDNLSCKSGSAKNPGLKIISRQVLEAVQQNASTTYKEVANLVSTQNENNPVLIDGDTNYVGQSSMDYESVDNQIRSSSKKGKNSLDGRKDPQKQEKNLRRRVYDSLNVLYAAGILSKGKNKQVLFNPNGLKCENRSREDSQDERDFGSQSQTFNANRGRPNLKQTCKDRVNQMMTDMEKEKRDTYGRIDAKYRKLVELTKQQMGLRRLIKRNRKKE